MSYNVSSWFAQQAASENPNIRRVFTIAGSDYSDYVLGWPTINFRWDELKPNNVTINLANEEKTFNFFKDAKVNVQADCAVKFGFKRNNFLSWSEQFDNPVWQDPVSEWTVSANTELDPNGGMTADAITIQGTSALIRRSGIGVSLLSFSIWLKILNGTLTACTVDHTDLSHIDVTSSVIASYPGWARIQAPGLFVNSPSWLDFQVTFASSGGQIALWGAQANSGSDVLGYSQTESDISDELISMFSGKVAEVSFKDASVSLRLVDKIQQLSDRIVGTTNSPAVFSSSTLLPSDIAWGICTSYGGLSSVKSSSNPDINYTAFQEWAGVFSADLVYMGASFTGQKVTEALRKIMENTQSAGFMADNKLTFARWTTVNTRQVTLTSDHIKTLSTKIRADSLINRQWVEFGFHPESGGGYWDFSVSAQNSSSVNSYGIRETVLKDESVWYVNSANALNMAQRSLFVNALPYDQVQLNTTMVACYQQVGETIAAVDPHLELSAGWRIMGLSLNLDNGGMTLDIDGSQVNTPFLLDYSQLDGTDILL